MNSLTLGLVCVISLHLVLCSPVGKDAVKSDGLGRVVCYFTNWAQYRPSEGKYTVSDIDPTLCSHLVFAFANIVDTHLEPSEYNDLESYEQFTGLKQTNPSLTTLLSVGGFAMGSAPFDHVTSSLANMAEFAGNVIAYLRQYQFDGLDVNWEYPAEENSEKFTNFHKVMFKSFEAEAILSGKPRLVLTSTLGNAPNLIYNTYELAEIHQFVDFANVMTYDLHGYWGCDGSTRTGFHSALYGDEYYDMASQNWTVSEYLSKGFPAAKLTLGIPTYGRTFTVCGESGLGYPACKAGSAGPYTNVDGSLAYYEICLNNINNGYTEVYSDKHQVPYSYKDNQWIGYDNVESVTAKVAYAQSKSLGGLAFWELASDDFQGLCGGGTYPLIKLATGASAQDTAAHHDGHTA